MKFVGKRLFVVLADKTLAAYDVGERETTLFDIKALKKFGKFDIFDVSIDNKTLLIGDTLNQNLLIVDIDTKKSTDISKFQKSDFVNARFSSRSGDIYVSFTTNRFAIIGCTGKIKFVSSDRIPPKISQTYNKFYSFAFGGRGKLIVFSKYSFYKFGIKDAKKQNLVRLPESALYSQ